MLLNYVVMWIVRSKIILTISLQIVFCSTMIAQINLKPFGQFVRTNSEVLSLSKTDNSHLIPKTVDDSDYWTKWKRRHFLYNGKFLDWKYEEYIEIYEIVGQAYIRDLEPEKARSFTRRILVLDPEYFYFHQESELAYLMKRFVALKFTIGFYGIGAMTVAEVRHRANNIPEGATSTKESTKNGRGLKSSFFAGADLIRNPVGNSPLRSLGFFVEYMYHSDRFVHNVTTTFPASSGMPATVKSAITELHDWQTLLIYPRIRLNTNKERWAFSVLGGMGINYLKSADLFRIVQKTSDQETIELSPVKLYPKERMRNNRNVCVAAGASFDYHVTRNYTFTFMARYIRMLENIVSDHSLINKPQQGLPLYYVDQDIYLGQLSLAIGISANIGTSPKWLGF